jgi:hypothetical protein
MPTLLAGSPQDYQTYRIVAPVQTHWRPATCAEFDCSFYLEGWVTLVPAQGPQADYIRADRSRWHRETRTEDGLARFEFAPGQRCFKAATHRVPVGRPPLYVMRRGAGRAAYVRRHSGPDAWLDDCRTHMQQVAKERE